MHPATIKQREFFRMFGVKNWDIGTGFKKLNLVVLKRLLSSPPVRQKGKFFKRFLGY